MATWSILLAAGSNSGGQLGLDHTNDINTLQVCRCDEGRFPPDGLKVLQLSAGSNHTIALLGAKEDRDSEPLADSKGQIWGCGSNTEGQLGGRTVVKQCEFRQLDLHSDLDLDTLIPSSDDSDVLKWQPVRVACGWNSSCIVLRDIDDDKDDMLVVLGRDNDFGQLGLGESKRIEAGVGLVRLRQAGNTDGVLRIDAVACGLRHTVVQCRFIGKNKINNVQVLGWGAARQGQLDSTSACKYQASYWNPHLVDEWKSSAEALPSRAILAAGKEHTAYCRGDGSLRIIGSNRQGQQSVGGVALSKAVFSVACTWNATLLLLKDCIIGSGNNGKGQLGAKIDTSGVAKIDMGAMLQSAANENRTVATLVCGSEHAMILVKNEAEVGGQVWGWGWNEHGNLAQGDEDDRLKPVCIWPPRDDNTSYRLSSATDIWAGCGTTFVQIKASE